MKSWLLENLGLKIIALIVSVVLFVLVRQDAGTVISVEVPLVLRLPSGYVLTEEVPESVSVRLRGRESALRAVHVDELGSISISPAPSSGRAKFTVRTDSLLLPAGVEIDSVSPSSISLTLEEQASRRVPIAAEKALSGKPSPGHQIGAVSFRPDMVEITGPRSVIETVNHVLVEPIDVTGRTAAFSEERWVVPDRRLVSVSGSAKVTVRVDVVPKATERVVLGVPILVLELSRRFELLPSAVDLVLVGEEDALAQIEPARLVVTIDGSDEQEAPARTQQLTIGANNVHNLPPGVAVDEQRLPTIFLRTIPDDPPPVPVEEVQEADVVEEMQ
ncbi:MAG: CdaR family protein [Myxococcota bacterium]|jgi:hypothetical protein|nr:CdaR family protein [Myxococcota bacterium]